MSEERVPLKATQAGLYRSTAAGRAEGCEQRMGDWSKAPTWQIAAPSEKMVWQELRIDSALKKFDGVFGAANFPTRHR